MQLGGEGESRETGPASDPKISLESTTTFAALFDQRRVGVTDARQNASNSLVNGLALVPVHHRAPQLLQRAIHLEAGHGELGGGGWRQQCRIFGKREARRSSAEQSAGTERRGGKHPQHLPATATLGLRQATAVGSSPIKNRLLPQTRRQNRHRTPSPAEMFGAIIAVVRHIVQRGLLCAVHDNERG